MKTDECKDNEEKIIDEVLKVFDTTTYSVPEQVSGKDVKWKRADRPDFSNARKRRRKKYKAGKPYIYSKTEILEYNEMQYIYGPEIAKQWADRKCHERTI